MRNTRPMSQWITRRNYAVTLLRQASAELDELWCEPGVGALYSCRNISRDVREALGMILLLAEDLETHG